LAVPDSFRRSETELTYSIHLVAEPVLDDRVSFEKILNVYNLEKAGPGHYGTILLLRKDDNSTIVGGLSGVTFRGWLHVDKLAIAEGLRRQGYGGRLLKEAEDEALRRGCHSVYLDTFSFQALPFYQKKGYYLFGELDKMSGDHKLFFLRRGLM
jgi:GNAT superfamily N-acetyltransferase